MKNYKLKVTGNAEQLPATEMQYPDLNKHRLGLQEFGGNGDLINEFFEPIENLSDITTGILQGQLYPTGLKILRKKK